MEKKSCYYLHESPHNQSVPFCVTMDQFLLKILDIHFVADLHQVLKTQSRLSKNTI